MTFAAFARPANSTATSPPESLPLNGNFTWRDDFNTATLSPAWIMLRSPQETWWSVDAAGGKLKLTPRAEALSGWGNPSFFGHCVRHVCFTVSTSLEVPSEPGRSFGLAVFQGERHHYFSGIRRETSVSIFLECFKGRGGQEVVKTVSVANPKSVRLRVMVNDAKCSFDYAIDAGAWETLASDVDAALLTTDVAGGFVGATIGPHARIDPIDPRRNP